MSRDLPEPERWCDLPARGVTAENAIGAIFKRVREATEPSDAAVARLDLRREVPTQTTRARLVWRVIVAASLIMATGGAVGAALYGWRRAAVTTPPLGDVEPRGEANKARPARRAFHVPVARGDADALAAPVAAPPPDLAPAVPSSPSTVGSSLALGRHASPGRSTPAGPPSEAAVLTSAFHELRTRHDAASALRSLDEYDWRFPAGALRSEARVARVEALLTLDRRRDALRLLEGIEDDGALVRDVRITRGELLAESGRCAGAISDFDVVLAVKEDDVPGGRALYGRASCHLRAGDCASARKDLDRYLLLHPSGPFAADALRVRKLLP